MNGIFVRNNPRKRADGKNAPDVFPLQMRRCLSATEAQENPDSGLATGFARLFADEAALWEQSEPKP